MVVVVCCCSYLDTWYWHGRLSGGAMWLRVLVLVQQVCRRVTLRLEMLALLAVTSELRHRLPTSKHAPLFTAEQGRI